MNIYHLAAIAGAANLLWWFYSSYNRPIGIMHLGAGIVLLGIWAVWLSG